MIASHKAESPVHRIAKHLFAQTPSQSIETVSIEPGEQPHIWLGSYDENNTPRGFSVAISPEKNNEDIITQVVTIKSANNTYDLVMNIANFSSTTVCADIRKI